jgi:transposase-like protein
VAIALALPVAGRDYPRTFRELKAWFPDEPACLEYLAGLRWPDGFVCPRCGATAAWRLSRGLWRCASCRKETSVTAGTIFAGTRQPLETWFAALWYVTNQKLGVSALGLQRVLGLGSYETAWAMLHKLRRAMVRPGREKLAGEVEVDESYVGGVATGKRGRGAGKKAIAAIAVEKHGLGMGRIRIARIPTIEAESLEAFLEQAVEPGAVVLTDGYGGYNRLGELGYTHYPTALSSVGDPAHVVMPRVHLVASLLKRWLLGTHQGAVRPQHLGDYLSEFTFRFSRRSANHRGLLFYRLLEQAVQLDHVPLTAIVGGRSS